MSAPDEEVDPYELLNIKQDATEQEIKTAYRQKSLKVHPDRVSFMHTTDGTNLTVSHRTQTTQMLVTNSKYEVVA